MLLIGRIPLIILKRIGIAPWFLDFVVVLWVMGSGRMWRSMVVWTAAPVLPTVVVSCCSRRWCGGIFWYAFFVLRFQWLSKPLILPSYRQFPIAFRRITPTSCQLCCNRFSIWLLLDCILWVLLSPSFGLGCVLVVPLRVLGDKWLSVSL